MRRAAALALVLAPLLAAAASAPATAGQGPRAAGQTALGLRLERILARRQNLAFSPLSLQVAFAMTDAGARGRTRRQIASALRLKPDGTPLHRAMAQLGAQLSQRPQLQMADAVFTQAGYPFRRAFLDVLARNYLATPQQANFAGDPDAARIAINDWVAEHTAGRITDLFPAGSIDQLMRLVLVNAIYLKADWADQFDPANTSAVPFTRLDGSTVSAPTMHRTGEYRLARGEDFDTIELPYTGGALAMDVIVPAAGRFTAVEQKLDAAAVGRALSALQPVEVSLALPTFTVTSSLDLVGPLRRLGVVDAFLPGAADFSGMSPRARGDQMHIAVVRQKAYVQVDETGTEAAAATGVGVGVTAAPGPFAIDRPFLFLLRDRPTGAILFVGRIFDPTQP